MRKLSSSIAGAAILLLAFFSTACNNGSALPITITLSPATSQTIDQGQSLGISALLINDASGKGVTWTLVGAGMLTSSTTTSVTYDAPPSVTARTTAMVTATSAAQTSVSVSLTITVNPPPVITSTSLPQASQGTAYSFTLTEAGGTAPFTWGVVAGQIPPGLTLNTAGGVISGTPTAGGTFTFTVQLTDAANFTSSASLSLTVAPAAPLAPMATVLPNGALHLTYTASLQATGGVPPYSWTVTQGNLPAGLDLSGSGIINGSPAATGTAAFTVQVADSAVPQSATASEALTITVNPVPFSVATTSLPSGTVGIAYSTTLAASGGVSPITWSIAGGSLPGWAALDSATGVISGKPTATGTSTFTVQAEDAEAPTAAIATQSLSITVTATQNGLLTGEYAFALGGYRAGLAGSFTADGSGNITGGTEDLENMAKGLSGANVGIVAGSYAVGTDDRGTLTFTDANHDTFTFDLALSPLSSSVAAKGAMIETDAGGSNFTGFLDLQNTSAFTTAAMAGGYVFGLSGWDAGGAAETVVGSATAQSGAISAGLVDDNDAGALTSGAAFTGTLSIGAFGRGTLAASNGPGSFAFYVVSAAEWLAISADPATGSVRTGIVMQQSPGTYAASSINGNLVFESASATNAPSPEDQVGLLTAKGDGTANFSFDVDAGGTVGAQTGTGTMSITSPSNGRFTMTLQAGQGTTDYVGYLVAPNTALVAGADSIPGFGSFEQQTSGTFTSSSLDGSYFFGSEPLVGAPLLGQPPLVASGELNFNGTGGLAGTTDSQQGGSVTTGQVTGTYIVSATGRVSLVPGTAILYVVSSSQAIGLYIGQGGFANPFIEIVER